MHGIEGHQKVSESEFSGDESATAAVEEYDVAFGFKPSGKKVPKKILKLNGVKVEVLVDSGSSINIVSESVLCKMKNPP